MKFIKLASYFAIFRSAYYSRPPFLRSTCYLSDRFTNDLLAKPDRKIAWTNNQSPAHFMFVGILVAIFPMKNRVIALLHLPF